MVKNFRVNATVVGLLFVLTMLVGMVDSYFVGPILKMPLANGPQMQNTLLLGVFCVFFMGIGLVAIATAIFPVVKRYSETIALTYVSFRIVECVLLLFGALLYLVLLSVLSGSFLVGTSISEFQKIVVELKLNAFQLSMVTLGIGSTLLNYSFYRSRLIPRWLSIWGMIGYILLFLSAVLDLLGVIDTINGPGAIMYVPGGLWELIIFPVWLFVKGFSTPQE